MRAKAAMKKRRAGRGASPGGEAPATKRRAGAPADRAAAGPRVRGMERVRPASVGRFERYGGIGEMARMVAHEVRNALSVMYNVATGLRRVVPLDLPDTEMLLGILDEELGRLDRMTHDLVSFATPAPPVRAQVRVRELLERAVQEARTRGSASARADVQLTIGPATTTAPLDPDRMQEALVGLLRNGIEASNGRGRVEVRVERVEGRLRIDVTDDGPGIPPADLERVFDPFYSTKASGVGLGLALCRQIARRHGGELKALPRPGGTGACFRLEIPVDGVKG